MQQLDAPAHSSGVSRTLLDEIQFYLGIARRGWKLIAVGLVIGLAFASLYLAQAKTLYRASARILLIQQAGRPLGGSRGNDPFPSSQDSEVSVATHLMLIRSPLIVEQAIKISGLGNISPQAVILGLTAKQPVETAKILEITYKSPSHDESSKLVEGVMQSYNNFLREKFQKNTNDVISLILKARDELSRDLASLERQYLEYRQKNPAYSADEKGRSFIVRRLDQWDQAMNQVLSRSLQLKSQLELGRKLAGEGLDQDAITNALNQLGGLGGTTTIAPPTPENIRSSGGQSVEKLREEIADVESRRIGAELLLRHLRSEMAESASVAAVSDRDLADAFYADAEVAKLRAERGQKQAKLQDALRRTRSDDDPAIDAFRRRVKELDEAIQRMWQQQMPVLAARLSKDSNEELSASVRKAEANLIDLKAKEAALCEHLGRMAAGQLQRLRQDRERLGRLQGEDHPQVRQIDQQIARIEHAKDGTTDRLAGGGGNALLGSIARSLEAVEAMRVDLKSKFDEDLDASKKTEIAQLVESNLRDNLDRQRTLFNSVVDQLKQAQLVSDFGSVSAQVVNPTEVAIERPRFLSIIALSLIAGCGLGAAGAYLVDHLDARIRTVPEMRNLLQLPVIGMIPQLSSEQIGASGRIGLLSHQIPRSALAESFKSTRTNLEHLRRNRRAQVLLVGSPQPGDGKSTAASNLAITLAHAGRKVLLIDGDLRKPSQHVLYGIRRGHGLTDAIQGGGSIEQLARPTFVDNLDVLASGSDVPNPAELLASPRLGELLDRAREAYDIIVIDSSPFLAVTDPSVISAVADGVLLVVRVACTRRHDVERMSELLETMGLPVLGIVINGISRDRLNPLYGSYLHGDYALSEQIGVPSAPILGESHGMNGRIEFGQASREIG